MKKYLTAILVLGILTSCKTEPKSQTGNSKITTNSVYADSLTLILDELYKIGRINGYGVAIVSADGTLYEKGIGYMDIESEKEYTENTLQNIGSVSKTFIGIALMKARELGHLKLDDPVNEYLPFEVVNPNHPDKAITIRHLATHTSGIKDTDIYDRKAYVLKDMVADSLLSSVEETLNPPDTMTPFLDFLPEVLVPGGEYYSEEGFLNSVPGTSFEYSNIGATLAALVLEMATEVPFDEFTSKHILEPLGMNSSGWKFDSIDLSKHSKLYADTDTQIPFYELITYPDGGMKSSAHDMALYLSELINGYKGNGKLLKPDSYQEYFTPLLDDSHFEERDKEFPYNDEYNMGIFMGHSGTGNIGHTGGDPGITTLMFFDPGSGLGQYIMINTSISDEEGVSQIFGSMQAAEEFAAELAL